MKYLFAGIVVCYLIHIPVFIKYDTNMSQGLFPTALPAAMFGDASEKPGVIAVFDDTCRHVKRQIIGDNLREWYHDCMPI
jgi:hypothetical protein